MAQTRIAAAPTPIAMRCTRWSGWSSVRTSGVSFMSVLPGGEPCTLGLRHVGQGGALAQLQRADVEGDGPAIGDRHLLGVVRHHAEAVRDDVEEVAVALLAEALDVEGRRPPVAAQDDHALPGADAVVARRAEDVVALTAPGQDGRRRWHRRLRDQLALLLAREIGRGLDGCPGDHGARDQRPAATVVGEERVGGLGLDLGLVVHVLPAAQAAHGQQQHEKQSAAHQWSTSATWRGTRRSRKRRVSSRSKSGSSASMQRKKRSRYESAKRGTLKTGWYGMGSPLSASMPKTATSAAPSTVHSKVIGMNDGQLFSGRPPTLMG